MAYVIAEPCVDVMDKSCLEACPVNCIYEGARKLYIHPDECIDCRACEPVCPVDAIFYMDDLPAHWAPYAQANVDFFNGIGAQGGATTDAPYIAAQPKRQVIAPPKTEPAPVWITAAKLARMLLR